MHAVSTPPTVEVSPEPVQEPRRRRSGGLRRERSRIPLLLSLPAILLLAALLAYPLYRMFLLSFQDMKLRHLINNIDPPWAGLANYTKILKDPVFWEVVRRTVVFTVVAVVLTVLIGLLVALLMQRVSRWVRVAMVVAMMFAWAMPQLVSAQIFKWMVDADFGVVNWLIDLIPGVNFAKHSWFADPMQGWIVITTLVVWGAVPFLAITMYAGLSQVPRELTEAATVDGANGWQVFRNVTFPILRPLIVIVTTLSVIWDFQVFNQIWVLRDSKPEQEYLTMAVYSYVQAFNRSNYSPGAAIAVITVLLMLGVMAFYMRQMFRIGDAD
jgi:N,N'-diacetylchitobiose transport system permease protein